MIFAQGEWCWLLYKTLMTMMLDIQRADAPEAMDHSPLLLVFRRFCPVSVEVCMIVENQANGYDINKKIVNLGFDGLS